jgi:hypothetical protein
VRYGAIAIALFLGGALTVGLLLVLPHTVRGAPPGSPAARQEETFIYNRVQTVTLRFSPAEAYTTSLLTTLQIGIANYRVGPSGTLSLPPDATNVKAYCASTNPPTDTCTPLIGTNVVTFAGTGWGDIYLQYDTRTKAWREPGTRVVTTSYWVGYYDLDYHIGLTNTIVYSRPEGFEFMGIRSVTPAGYDHNEVSGTLKWVFTSTPRLQFTVVFTDSLLGSDLYVERVEMSNLEPELYEPVRYTVTVRNQGTHKNGRPILAELLVRPLDLGLPTVLSDHVGGWSWQDPESGLPKGYQFDALFKWHAGYDEKKPFWHIVGLVPGDEITGTTVLSWPYECDTEPCGVWVKVDPAYLDLGLVYYWWGYNAEALACELTGNGVPTCVEERNNIGGVDELNYSPTVYLPLVMRNSG